VDERPVGQNLTASGNHDWIPAATVTRLREVIARYLDGERNVETDVEALASALANAARDGAHTPERMLITVRALWRDFTLSQHDRLQLVSLYDRLVRRTIDRYYED
jgi:hypothetical protein